MCVCMFVLKRMHVHVVHGSAHMRVPALTVTFNIYDHFHLEIIVKINIIILERGLAARYRV